MCSDAPRELAPDPVADPAVSFRALFEEAEVPKKLEVLECAVAGIEARRLRSSNNLDPILNPCSLSVDSNSVDDLL